MRTMPRSVRMGGGPGSTTRESNFPGRRGRTGVVVASVQWRRSVEYERPIWSVLSAAVPSQYIQYLPSIFSGTMRSEEHTSELQSRVDLVCRLLLEKKKQRTRDWL